MREQDSPELDFARSLEAGLRRANEIESTLEEIRKVLSELDEAVQKGTNSTVSISIQRPRRTALGDLLGVVEFFKVNYTDPEDEEPEELEVLARLTPTKSLLDTRRVCSITWSVEGYPVSIDSGVHIEACIDGVALRRAFSEILGRPTTGRKLRALMQRHEERAAQGEISDSPVKALSAPDSPDSGEARCGE